MQQTDYAVDMVHRYTLLLFYFHFLLSLSLCVHYAINKLTLEAIKQSVPSDSSAVHIEMNTTSRVSSSILLPGVFSCNLLHSR